MHPIHRGQEGAYNSFVKSLGTVLVAEQDHSHRQQIRATLEDHCPGWLFVFVDDGEDALAYLRGTMRMAPSLPRPVATLLLLNQTIPGVSASQILDWLRRQPVSSSVVTGLLCGPGEAPDQNQLSQFPRCTVLSYPIVASEIATLVAVTEAQSSVSPHSEARESAPALSADEALLAALPGLDTPAALPVC